MTPTLETQSTLEQVREYYGRTLRAARDLKTSACCTTDSLPEHVRVVLPLIENEVVEKFYGCGSPIPSQLAGRTVLDLGCGTGRDVYLISKLVGPQGRVIGIDMTDEQLDIARRHVDAHMRRFGFDRPNVDFRRGYIEDLAGAGIDDESVDVVISNCVINLSPDKWRVFSEVFRVLRPGGELYFSDIFAGRRIPEGLQTDPLLRGECLSGAMYVEDFRRMLRSLGCPDYRVVSRRPVALNDPHVLQKIGMVDFHSITIRAFKIVDLEDLCEDYGQAAVYRGTLPESPHAFVFDDHHVFPAGKVVPVCGNTASMLEKTRYGRHFTILGDRSTHYGPFPCGTARTAAPGPSPSAAGCCS